MKRFFAVACIVGAIAYWYAVTLGLVIALRANSVTGFIFSVVGSIIVIALMLCTRDIMVNADSFHRITRAFWLIAFLSGLYVAYLAGCNQIILGKSLGEIVQFDDDITKCGNRTQQNAVRLAIFFLAVTPIAVSYRLKSSFSLEEDEGRQFARKSR